MALTPSAIKIRDTLNIPTDHLSDFEINEQFVNLPTETKVDIFTRLIPEANKRITHSDARKWYKAFTGEVLILPISLPFRGDISAAKFASLLRENDYDDLGKLLQETYALNN